MRKVMEAWECGDCGVAVNAEVLFAWCDGCSKVLCVNCLEVATTCDGCEMLVCRSCTIRTFAVECKGCSQPMHTDCFNLKKDVSHALCDACGRSAEAMWA